MEVSAVEQLVAEYNSGGKCCQAVSGWIHSGDKCCQAVSGYTSEITA